MIYHTLGEYPIAEFSKEIHVLLSFLPNFFIVFCVSLWIGFRILDCCFELFRQSFLIPLYRRISSKRFQK